MALQSNAFAIMQQNKQKQNDMWHEDFFATMNNKVWVEPKLFWQPGMANIEYQGLEKGNPTSSWSEYSSAAKSRGLQPDYKRFMETFNAIKTTRDTKILDSFQQLSTMYANNDAFKDALKETIRANPELRVDLAEGMKLNPDHPGNTFIASAFQEYGQDPWEGAKQDAFEGLAGDQFNPLGMGWGSAKFAGKVAGVGIPRAMGAYTTGQALKRFLPGGGLVQFGEAVRGVKGGGPFGRAPQAVPKRTNVAGKTTGGFERGPKSQRLREQVLKRRKGRELVTGAKGTDLNKMQRTINSLKGIDDPDIKDWRGKDAQRKAKKWTKTMRGNLGKGIRQLERIKKAGGIKDVKGLDQQIKNLKKSHADLNNLGKGKRKITKDAFNKALRKGGGRGGQKSLEWAIKKVGWKGILSRARKHSWKLFAKLVASGVLKGGSVATFGASGLLSLGMDAWMMVDLYKLVDEISDEYSKQDKAVKGGAGQYLSTDTPWKGPGSF